MSDARLVACSILCSAGFIGAAVASLGGPKNSSSQLIVFLGAVVSIFFLIPVARRIIGKFDGKHLKAFVTGQSIE